MPTEPPDSPQAPAPPAPPAPPPSVNPPTQSQTGNLLAPGQASVQGTVTGQTGQDTQTGVAATFGLPAFNDSHSQQIQLGIYNTGIVGQLQNNIVTSKHDATPGQDDAKQHSVLINAQLSMNPKLAEQLGVNVEQDWGGKDPSRPKYQLVEQVYGINDAGAQVGPVQGTGQTVGGSVLGQRNYGITDDVNPKYSLGIEVKMQGTHIDGGKVNEFMATGGVVASKNWTLNNGATVVTVGGVVYGGVKEDYHAGPHTGGVQPVVGGGLVVGVAFGGSNPPPKSDHDEQKKDEPAKIVETTVKGIVSKVDTEHDKLIMDVGGGRTEEYKLSKLRNDATDPKEFDKSMKWGERVDITTTQSGRSHISQDYGGDNDWRKGDLMKRAQSLPNGDLKIDNLTMHKELGDLYKPFMSRPATSEQSETELLNQLNDNASGKTPMVQGHAANTTPDFSRGSGNLPKPAVHMAADGKGGERTAVNVPGGTFTGMEDKNGITTIHYKLGGRDLAMSVPSTVGGYGKDPNNPYNEHSIDTALAGGLAPQAARDLVKEGTKNLVRDLDKQSDPVPFSSPNGTTAQDLLKRTTFDPKTGDLHIGNLEIKKDAALPFLKELANEGPRDPEFVARVERLADSKTPHDIDLAKTKAAVLQARDAEGFGEPPNPVKLAFQNLKEGEKFDLKIDKDNAKLVNQTERIQTPIHSYGIDDPQPAPPERGRGHQLVHGGPG
jgi:hypothetical protein